MEPTTARLDGMEQEEKLRLLELLLHDLRAKGLLSRDTLVQVASDVMLLDYREDHDLRCFDCVPHESEEE